MSGGGVTASYTYDNIGRLTKEELTTGIVKTYNYDNNGNRTSFMLTKDGTQQMNTVYAYDKLDRLISVTNGYKVSSYTYDRNGRLLNDTTGGYETAYSNNMGGLITGLSTVNGENTVQSYSYGYYPDGNLAQKQSTVNGSSMQYSYRYDNAGRLKREQAGDSITSYTYDNYNNRAEMSTGGVQYSYSYDANNRLTKRVKTEGETEEYLNYTYDNNGNMLSWLKSVYEPAGGSPALSFETDGTDYALYGYDKFNRLNSYTNGVTKVSYSYDGNNLRQSKTVDGVTTNHIWDGSDMVMEINGTDVNKYYRGATGLSYAEISGAIRYYHKDEHGNVAALTDNSGAVIKTSRYDAFGNPTEPQSSIYDPFGYCGEYTDEETGLIYLRNRYYSPSIGRFITEDPIKDGFNWYVYCGNNPVMFVDFWGLFNSYTKLSNGTYNSEDVLTLQKKLNSLGYVGADGKALVEDCDFGDNTEYAVNKYKEDNGLWNFGEYRGVVGLTTWQHLGLPYIQIVGQTYFPNTQLSAAPKIDIVTFDVNFGYGLYAQANISGVEVEIGGKAYYSLNDIYLRPTMTFDASLQARLTEKLSAGVEGYIKMDTYSGEQLEKGGYAGVRIGNEVFGINSLVDGTDITLSAGAGIYLGAGGEVNININLSEAYRQIKKLLE